MSVRSRTPIKVLALVSLLALLLALILIITLLSGISQPLTALVSAQVEQGMNRVHSTQPIAVSTSTHTLHDSLLIADWHADTLLWSRDLSQHGHTGHGDLPRYLAGNTALQMFTTVTKSPSGLNYHSNSGESFDNITALAMAQGWPVKSWQNLTERALYQASRLHRLAQQYPEKLMLIRNQRELAQLLEKRAQGQALLGGLLGTEGSHALEGDLANIQRLYDEGFRMMSLQHFFDNRLGDSLHGRAGKGDNSLGLSDFGRQAIIEMQRLGIIIDLSHSSEQVVRDVLALNQQSASPKPLIVSHTGFYGHCQSPRNISDELMQAIAKTGGLIAVGYWHAAICDVSPQGIASAIAYGIELVGVDHIALGSDFDGAVTTPFAADNLAQLTQALVNEGLTESQIRAVMGANMLRLLQQQLPLQ